MKLDLERLREMHPALPLSTATSYAHRAALALGRRHEPGASAEVTLDGESVVATLVWEKRPAADALQLDYHRVTEDGAEAVALALVHSSRSWVVLRRLQREEHADWLLRETTSRRLVALEISYHPQSGWFDEGPQRGPPGDEGSYAPGLPREGD